MISQLQDLLNKYIRKYKFYGQFQYPVDKFIFDRYFRNKKHGIFVECGAYDGQTECSCKFFEEFREWKGYNLEPVPWLFKQLKKNRPESINLNLALSNKNGEAAFNAVNHPDYGLNCTNGSLAHSDSHLKILKEMQVSFKKVTVQCITWDNFIKSQKISHIDLLVLDVEGHELEVLEGMSKKSILPQVFCIEFGHLNFEQIKQKLEKLGYRFDLIQDANAYFIKK